ncbi:MAG: hypothetical protein OXL96_07735 [Candidatus Poribacteria bacterium]|nr:hypothetical protein [Candidatus Poribacteria bacterium]
MLLAIGFLSLRSDVPDEPIKVYKAVEPLAKSTAEAPIGDTSQGGDFHADGDPFHGEPHAPVEPSTEAADVSQPRIRQGAETIAFGGETESQTPQPPSEEYLAEQRYDVAAAEYFKALQEYHRKYQALREESELLYTEATELRSYTKVDPKTLGREKALEIRDAMLAWIEKKNELRKREASLEAEKPIRPTPPAGYGKE